MIENVITVNHTNSLRDVHDLIKSKHIHHVPVVSGKKLIGLISKTDLERITFVSNFEKGNVSTQMFDALKIEEVMTKDIVSIQKDETVLDAAEILAINDFHALPVMDGEAIVGILTTKDLLKYLVENH